MLRHEGDGSDYFNAWFEEWVDEYESDHRCKDHRSDGNVGRLGLHHHRIQFSLIGMVVFAHSWYVFLLSVGSTTVPAVLALVHDLLLVIILLELFRTIINFLKTKVITLEPFLYICVIASTRRILTTGAQIGSMEDLTDQVFHRYLLDLGSNVLVVLALVLAVHLVRRAVPVAAS